VLVTEALSIYSGMLPGIALELKGGEGEGVRDVLHSVIEMKGTTKFIFFVLPSDKISSCLFFFRILFSAM